MGSNQHIPARRFLCSLKLPKFHRRSTKTIWHLSMLEKVEAVKRFLLEVAKAKFCFAPRGVGTSSYRLYQSMMVGTVPIVSGMQDYPFRDEVDWRSFCVIDDKHDADYVSLLKGYEVMREAAIRFWDEYVFIPKSYARLTDKVIQLL